MAALKILDPTSPDVFDVFRQFEGSAPEHLASFSDAALAREYVLLRTIDRLELPDDDVIAAGNESAYFGCAIVVAVHREDR